MINFKEKYNDLYDSSIPKKEVTASWSNGDDLSCHILISKKQDLFTLVDTINPHGFVENNCLSYEDKSDINLIRILRTAYLNLYKEGLIQISLKDEDLLKYVPDLKEMLNFYNFNTDIIFYKESDSYDEYKSFLVRIFCEKNIGNIIDESIIINCPDEYIEKCQKQTEEDIEIVDKCSEIINNELSLKLIKSID